MHDRTSRGHLITEQRNERSANLDRLSIADAFDLIQTEDAGIAAAVARARTEICQAIELIVAAFEQDGRLLYVGAGTSGRLGALDAAECPPTFLSDPRMVQGILAGGAAALTQSIEGAEDFPENGAREIERLDVGPADVVFGIASGGTTPFVHGAIEKARKVGAKTVLLACVPQEQWGDCADVSIRVITGPEVLTGSTRLKAGTATKMVLNMVSTIAMSQIGKVYQNLMVDVNTKANAKLVDRGIRIIQAVTDQSPDEASALLDRAAGNVKTALVMALHDVDPSEAIRLLDKAGGRLARIVGQRGAVGD